MLRRRPALSPEARERANEILYASAAREGPRILIWFAGIVVAFDVLAALTGTIFPLTYYLSDVVQVTYMLIVHRLIRHHRVSDRWAPWLFASALIVSACALSVQQLVAPEAMTLPIMMIGVIAAGGLAMFWAPMLVAGIPVVVVITATAAVVSPDHADDWALAAVTGLGAGAAMLAGRRHSAETLAEAQLSIETIAIRDQSTGLLNRRGLELSAATLTALVRRTKEPMFAAFVDINGLKAVNDKFGHLYGDLIICRVAEAIRCTAREADLVARWGGDEFLILGLGPAPDETVYLQRVQRNLDVTGLDGIWDGGVSIGIAANSDGDVEPLIKEADKRMYESRLRPIADPALD